MFRQDRVSGSSVRIKICGITNAADAHRALDCGADALGFNFAKGSKRCLDLQFAGTWMAELPREAAKVAVLVNPTWAEAVQFSNCGFIDSLQLHGAESPEFCHRLANEGVSFTKALPVSEDNSLDHVPDFSTKSVLLDSCSTHGFGGGGMIFSWKLGREFVEKHPDLQVSLAGGLTPENVVQAINEVRPFAVDVTTGVESFPGQKDPQRLQAFITAVRSC
ncbi:MAG: phosphoribosylanthranilate isomerase [Verrucomicrobiota bacterium]|jgi:phosphoribosylanthranilate isomerase